MTMTKFRVARPTTDLAALHAFYADGLGLVDLGTFHGHAGYDGHLYATVDARCELEFTCHADERAIAPPSDNHLLVFYFADARPIADIVERLRARGVEPVEPRNPYWTGRGVVVVDPDGWHVVLCDVTTLKRPA